MIEIDPSEFLYTDLSDEALLQIAALCGPEIKDKLLVPKADDADGRCDRMGA